MRRDSGELFKNWPASTDTGQQRDVALHTAQSFSGRLGSFHTPNRRAMTQHACLSLRPGGPAMPHVPLVSPKCSGSSVPLRRSASPPPSSRTSQMRWHGSRTWQPRSPRQLSSGSAPRWPQPMRGTSSARCNPCCATRDPLMQRSKPIGYRYATSSKTVDFPSLPTSSKVFEALRTQPLERVIDRMSPA